MPDLKTMSKGEFTHQLNSLEAIQTSALMRMADSMEKIAEDRLKLERQIAWYVGEKRRLEEALVGRDFKIRSLRGVITKLKKKYHE